MVYDSCHLFWSPKHRQADIDIQVKTTSILVLCTRPNYAQDCTTIEVLLRYSIKLSLNVLSPKCQLSLEVCSDGLQTDVITLMHGT